MFNLVFNKFLSFLIFYKTCLSVLHLFYTSYDYEKQVGLECRKIHYNFWKTSPYTNQASRPMAVAVWMRQKAELWFRFDLLHFYAIFCYVFVLCFCDLWSLILWCLLCFLLKGFHKVFWKILHLIWFETQIAKMVHCYANWLKLC